MHNLCANNIVMYMLRQFSNNFWRLPLRIILHSTNIVVGLHLAYTMACGVYYCFFLPMFDCMQSFNNELGKCKPI